MVSASIISFIKPVYLAHQCCARTKGTEERKVKGDQTHYFYAINLNSRAKVPALKLMVTRAHFIELLCY